MIVHVLESFGGGVAGVVAQLVRLLPGFTHVVVHAVREGEVDMAITRSKFPAGTQFLYWEHARREIDIKNDWKALQALVALLKPYREHALVHLHSSKAGFLGRIACRWLGIDKVIYTPGGAAFLRRDNAALTRFMYGALEWIAHRMSGVVVACGPSEQAAFERFGVPARLIPNGTKIDVKSEDTDRINTSTYEPSYQGDSATPLVVVTASRATFQKNPELFAQIAGKCDPQKATFTWVGTGELASVLQAPVTVTGWVEAGSVRTYLQNADVYVSTSLWEGLPLSVLEAMNLGLPLILSRCAGNTDLVVEGVNGFLYDTPSDAVAILYRLYHDPSLRLKMGEASQQRCSSLYDERLFGAAYAALYIELGAEPGADLSTDLNAEPGHHRTQVAHKEVPANAPDTRHDQTYEAFNLTV
jgi:glycosyltransferase involved in cell wall biosynthesis